MKQHTARESFYEEVYSVVRQIPRGKVLSYGQIARLIWRPQNSRMVGQAMWAAPKAYALPCHRVVNSAGRTAPGWPEQKGLLEEEGVALKKNGSVDMKKYTWDIITGS